jgi:hypothetical protein
MSTSSATNRLDFTDLGGMDRFEVGTSPSSDDGSLNAQRTYERSNQFSSKPPLMRSEADSLGLPVIDTVRPAVVERITFPQRRNEIQRIASSQLLAEWHGQVTEVLEKSFAAQLIGCHGSGVLGEEEDAIIPIDEVRETDLALLESGAFFRLCISYEVSPQGNKRRYTEVVFRRLPAYRKEELAQAQTLGRELARGLRVE